MSHYTEGRRWSHIHKAWVFSDQWNDKEEIARLEADASTLARIAELERENAELRKIANLVRMKLTSGNGIPVERCTIKASEIAALAKIKEAS